jgi:hypothetical protein
MGPAGDNSCTHTGHQQHMCCDLKCFRLDLALWLTVRDLQIHCVQYKELTQPSQPQIQDVGNMVYTQYCSPNSAVPSPVALL